MPKTIKRPIFGNAVDPAGVTDLENARLIDITLLSPNPFQPRTAFDPVALDELAASIRAHGILQALSVRETPGAPDTYQIIAGERRKLAAEIAGLAAVPCLVQDVDDRTMAMLALTENVQREDLTPLELASFCDRLRGLTGLSARALSDQLGKNHNYVDDLLKLIRYPRVAELLRSGKIANPTVATAIADIDDEGLRSGLLDRAGRGERLRVRDVQEARERHNARPALGSPAGAAPHGAPFTDSLRKDSLRGEPAASPPAGRDAATPSGPAPSHDTPDARPPSEDRTPRSTVPDKLAPVTPMDEDVVHLHDLRIIQLREGRDGEPRQLDTADKATVLRLLRADLAWLENSDRPAPHD